MSQTKRDAKRDPQPGDKFSIYDCRFEVLENDGEHIEDHCYQGTDKGDRQRMPLFMWRRLMSTAKVLRRSK